jgi:hypothetical protein
MSDTLTPPMGMTRRRRLPNRRDSVTHDIGGGRFRATIGFDKTGRPRERFLNSTKPGSEIDVILGDVAVAVSVALQCGTSAEAMAGSVGRAGSPPVAVSVIGAGLDLLAEYE